ncbi:MAG: transposase, partial [Euryarchaeota archaeon]|nr:transposase [Euryarchaeota archaeon]
NGILEGINSVVQLLKRSARGYRNIQNFMTMIYLRLGHLDFQLGNSQIIIYHPPVLHTGLLIDNS